MLALNLKRMAAAIFLLFIRCLFCWGNLLEVPKGFFQQVQFFYQFNRGHKEGDENTSEGNFRRRNKNSLQELPKARREANGYTEGGIYLIFLKIITRNIEKFRITCYYGGEKRRVDE